MFTVHLQVMDKHLSILAKQHLETRFVKIHAEKSPFLAEKLKIIVLPTLALIKNAKVDDYVVWWWKMHILFTEPSFIFLYDYSGLEGFHDVGITMSNMMCIRWDLISLVGRMSSAQRNWRKGWLNPKLSLLRVNHH